jgi:hypothetical protein
MSSDHDTMNDQQRRRNLRTGLMLGLLALAFFVGFIVKMSLLK